MSNPTEWDMETRALPKKPFTPKHIWNVINAMYSVVTTIRPSSSGHWVTKPVWDLTSNIAIHGSRTKTRHVPYSMNKREPANSPTFSARCIMITITVSNIVKATLTNPLSNANMHTLWATHKVDSRSTGTSPASTRNIKVDLSGTLSTSPAIGKTKTV